jgi:glycerol uptake facilitator-like aquaporin
MIICFQILGAYFGIILGHVTMGEPSFLCPFEGRIGCLMYEEHWVKVFLLEFWCTFFFTLCILCQIFTRTQDSRDGVVQAGAIAMTLYAMITFAGPITGGCFNPAFGITQSTYQVGYMNSLGVEGKVYQKYMWIYCTSPFLGGIIASLFMRFVHNPNLGIIVNDPYPHDSKTHDERPSIENS